MEIKKQTSKQTKTHYTQASGILIGRETRNKSKQASSMAVLGSVTGGGTTDKNRYRKAPMKV